MLIKAEKNVVKIDSELIDIFNGNGLNKIYIWRRCINPIDFKNLKNRFSNYKVENLKNYLYSNEISYIEISTTKIEVYRDFFGLSDIYYFQEDNQIMISESLKDYYSQGVNSKAVEQYQRIGYVPGANTIISNVKKAYPGEKITYIINSNEINHSRKPFEDLKDNTLKYSPDTFQEQFESNMSKKVINVDSIFLSGGFDSSLLAYFLYKNGNASFAFTGFTEDERNQIEKERSIKTAKLFCKKHELTELKDDLFEEVYLDVFRYMNEPFADNAILGEAILAKQASLSGLKRMVEGEAADAFWGHAKEIKKYLLINKIIRNDIFRKIASKIFFIKKYRNLGLPRFELLKNYSGCKSLTEKEFRDISYNLIGKDSTEDYNLINILIFLSSNIGFEVPKVKLAAISSGINIIAPFLDSKMLKMALTVPPGIKYKKDKGSLKNIYDKILKRENYEDQKMGFLVPTADWILNKHLSILLIDKFYKKSKTEELILEFKQDPRIELNQKIWRIFVLNQWYEVNKSELTKRN